MKAVPQAEAARRAPVYRNLEASNTLLGLAFPAEWGGVLSIGFVGALSGAPNLGAAAALGLYALLRLVGRSRPEGYLQQSVLWLARRIWTGGAASAAARTATPRFPFGRHDWRDRPRCP